MSTRVIRGAAGRVALAGVLVIGVVACGNDDEEASGPDGEAATTYCADLLEFNATVLQTDLSPDSSAEEIAATAEAVVPRWDALEASAPEELRNDLEPLAASIVALDEGDPEPFNAEETFVAYTDLVGASVPICDFELVSVEAGDYTFDGVPDDLTAGTTAVEIVNVSTTEMHEFIVFKKNDPDQSADEILEMDEAEMEASVSFAGATFAPPETSGTGLMEFEAGSYMAVCFIPIGGEDGPPHFTAGQVAEFEVT